ncbi:type VII secretion target [Solwaraspora sp. WMMD406]|uniref:type VII secretion target n=1 Tax=Solwaraspora sp. WMMD406 TaxID=3016095 RepID=UPI0024171813|nr:type VII secretion target [Solwaraspora sp. WMMD406]MDG4763406.1 type VII secretion target [Solwaraspora sp. WMMD406]
MRAQADELARSAERLTGTARELAELPSSDLLPAEQTPGRLGALGAALRRQWQIAVVDRATEAADAGARLADLATGLRAASGAYQDTDDAVRDHHPDGV